jgi:hypothetical protein
MEYIFTLKYQLAADDCDHEELVERLAEAGCDDATIGVGQPGRIALAFTRENADARSAILSALQNVKQAIPSARLVEAAPDFVGLTDVADVAGMTRQNMLKQRRSARDREDCETGQSGEGSPGNRAANESETRSAGRLASGASA